MALSPDLLLHHERLDEQHGGLLRLVEAAAGAVANGSTAEAVRTLGAFTEAMLEHTATEEALMEESLFPDRVRHRTAHEVFLADLQQLGAELARTGPTPQIAEWLRVRVPEWLRFHIAVNDTRLGVHLAQRKGGGREPLKGDTRRRPS